MSVCVRGFYRGVKRGRTSVYAFVVSPVVRVEDAPVCMHSLLPLW